MYTLLNEVAMKTNGITYKTFNEAKKAARKLGPEWIVSAIIPRQETLH